jgi:hypothetical protein
MTWGKERCDRVKFGGRRNADAGATALPVEQERFTEKDSGAEKNQSQSKEKTTEQSTCVIYHGITSRANSLTTELL